MDADRGRRPHPVGARAGDAVTERIRVGLADHPYDIVVGRDLLRRIHELVEFPIKARTAALVTQPAIAGLYADAVEGSLRNAGLEVVRVEVPDGEVAKDLQVLAGLYTTLARIPLTRQDLVVALGGGVVGDLAGFLAATWNRGVPVLQLPTTLLAQVDASIGGKTGVNLAEGKNLVGAFHQPLAVIADVATLATLPDRERIAGLGEVVKYGFIRDSRILDLLESDPAAAKRGDPDLLEELVRRSAAVKASVVAADERETGERAHLNLGHTHGHAVEALTGYTAVLHGEAVAIGMCTALRVGILEGITPPDLLGRCEAILTELGLPTTAPQLDRDDVWATMARDKKADAGVRFVLLEGLCRCTVTTPDRANVDRAIDEVEAG
ncbi:MAG: 3-dehydroquinate synthase [Actinobacteria bacterium]|nr:3-dehydroquinate synthase [Actinomycetota bacterium]